MRVVLSVLCLAWLSGCVGHMDQVNLEPNGAGFQARMPEPGTRIIVWGNHAGSVDQASTWLHQQGYAIIDRTRVQQGLNANEAKLEGSSKDWPQILEAGKRVEADLVTFVEVSNVKGGQKFSLSQVRASPSFALTVEVRGVNPKTGEIITKSKAWQTAPKQNTNMLLEDLTTLALGWAWSPLSADLHLVKKRPTEEKDIGNKATKNPASMIATQSGSLLVTKEVLSPSPSDSPPVYEEKPERSVSRSQYSEIFPKRVVNSQVRNSNGNSMDANDRHELDAASTSREVSSLERWRSNIGSGALSVLYTPAKLAYAGLGGIFGGLAYLVTGGDQQVTDTIWKATLEGDYYVTPEHLNGDDSIQFMGETQGEARSINDSSSDPFIAQSSTSKN